MQDTPGGPDLGDYRALPVLQRLRRGCGVALASSGEAMVAGLHFPGPVPGTVQQGHTTAGEQQGCMQEKLPHGRDGQRAWTLACGGSDRSQSRGHIGTEPQKTLAWTVAVRVSAGGMLSGASVIRSLRLTSMSLTSKRWALPAHMGRGGGSSEHVRGGGHGSSLLLPPCCSSSYTPFLSQDSST